jgi:ribose/xylose/arabinose/galactoside ABC-type transport system permease subunit
VSTLATSAAARLRRGRLQRSRFPVATTAVLLLLLFVAGSLRYSGFASTQVVVNVLIDNAHLLVVAVGMTFVILTGGIDLSVGALAALTTVLAASLLAEAGWPFPVVLVVVLLVGVGFGWVMGAIIHYFEIQPFIVTLAGMFFARGLSYVISIPSISIVDPTFVALANARIPLGGRLSVTPAAVAAVVAVLAATFVLHGTPFGRRVYALGGSERSALLMGLPVARTKIAVYTISGFCSALGGVLLSSYTLSGYSLNGVALELDAIAAVVIGGTLLTGGTGTVVGSLLGVGVLGLIQTALTFEGTLSSWWTRIVIGALLLIFIVAQRLTTTARR